MDNWLYYIIVAGFFAISQVMEKRRKQAKKDGRNMAPPPQSDASRPAPKPQRKRPTYSPDSLDEVLAEMLGIPKQGKPAQKQPPKTSKPSSTPKPVSQQRTATTPPEARKPIAGNQEKIKSQPQSVNTEETSAYGSYTKPKSVADERNTLNNQPSSAKKGSVNLRQAVIYQTILERKYS